MLVVQRMAIRLMRLDGDDRRAQSIEVYLSRKQKKKKKKEGAKSEDD